MIVAKLAGGLGNQMFQYAAGRALAKKYHTELLLDLSFLLDRTPRENFVYRNFNLDIFDLEFRFAKEDQTIKFGQLERFARYAYPVIKLLTGKKLHYLRENPYRFDESFFKAKDNTYLEGFWQSAKYFQDIETEIRQDFRFKQTHEVDNDPLLKKFSELIPVCLNVRRGDFVSNPNASEHHGHCTMEYFEAGITYLKEKVGNPHFFVFSDDIEWCRENFVTNEFTVVGHEYAGKAFANYLFLMTCCKHFIIPNSSFGWWAAWLNNSKGKIVVAPAKWYNNPKFDTSSLIPDQWVQL